MAFEQAVRRQTRQTSVRAISPGPRPGMSAALPVALGLAGAAVFLAGLFLYLRPGPPPSDPDRVATTVTPEMEPGPGTANTGQTGSLPDEGVKPDSGQTTIPSGSRPPRGTGETGGPPAKAARRSAASWEFRSDATAVWVDGRRIAIKPAASPEAPRTYRLYLSQGTHFVRCGNDSEWIDVESDFLESYVPSHRALAGEDPDQSRACFEAQVHLAAEHCLAGPDARYLHLLGNHYFLLGQRTRESRNALLGAARRRYIQAIRLDPGLAPSHLNLAHISKAQGETDLARRHAIAASLLNLDNVFGIQSGIDTIVAELGAPASEPVLDIPWGKYRAEVPTDPLDWRMLRYHRTILRYASADSERAKIWSNLGLHFAGQEGKHRLAEQYYQRAVLVLKGEEDEGVRKQVLKQVSNNLALLASKYELPEKREYELLARFCAE